MAIKYLAGERMVGTAAERAALTTALTVGDGTVTGTAYSTDNKLGTHSLFLDNGQHEEDSTHYSNQGNHDLSITSDMSISCWIKSDSHGDNGSNYRAQTIINQGFNFTGDEFGWWFGHGVGSFAYGGYEDSLMFSAFDNSANANQRANIGTATNTISQGTWYHVGVTKDGAEVRFYLNGSLVQCESGEDGGGTGSTGMADFQTLRDTSDNDIPNIVYRETEVENGWIPSKKIWVGTRDPLANDAFYKGDFDGRIDDLGVWNTTLSAANMASLYNSGTGALCNTVASASLKLYLNFNENVENQANVDTYPNLSNGTIFEESDTGKHYMWDGTSAWNETT